MPEISRRNTWFRAAALAGWLIVLGSVAQAAPTTREQMFREQIRPLLVKYCFECHAEDGAEADVHLDRFDNVEQLHHARPVWLRVREKVLNGEMPPVDATQLAEVERRRLADAIEKVLSAIDCATEARPGRVTIRRLNRIEYRNTIRDLCAVDYPPAADFPADDVGYGFDNIADVLSLPPILLEKYLTAAEEIAARMSATWASQAETAETARQVLRPMATRAFRRPLNDEELDRLVQLALAAQEQTRSFDASLRVAIQSMLISPHFLFRIERDPSAGEPARLLDDYELATRLSYFLWSTMPDDELFRLAEQGRLRDETVLAGQVERMLKSPRSQALVDNFAAQWLELRKFDEVPISRDKFPGFDESLRADMRRETLLFFEHLLREDRSILELLSADYSFLNERLAKHYGIAGVQGEQFREVSLAGSPRSGLITHGSVLTVTSNPTRTSPVKRGKWLLENLLGEPPPPPPPNVPKLEEQGPAVSQGSLRQRLEQHRSDPACASCHRTMDALGFALENYDAVGAWRVKDGSWDIDAAGELPTGERFTGSRELAQQLVETRKQQFLRCVAEKMLTYALGRGLEFYDACAVDQILAVMNERNDQFSTLVQGIVRSEPFRKRETAR